MSFQFTVGSDSSFQWSPETASLIVDLPETLFFGSKKWSFCLTEFNLSQSLVNVPAGEIKIDSTLLKIPDSCFTDIKELLSFISRRDDISFSVKGSTIVANFGQRRSKVVLNESLRQIFGFKSKNVYSGDINAIPWDLWVRAPGFYLKWEVAGKQIYNNKYIKAVKHIPDDFKNVKYGHSIYFKEELPIFIDLEAMEITRIHLQLMKNDGTPLKLLPNAHFRATFAFKSG